MPRLLPWKVREGEASSHSPRPARSTPGRRVTRGDETDSALSSDGGEKKRKKLGRYSRSRSSSPLAAPREIFMNEDDERHRMVEDEFLTTARLFTAHLHAAEYKRLKEAAELENTQMIRNISRPVVGTATDMVKMKEERRLLRKRQRHAKKTLVKEEESTESEGEESWQMNSLHGLMESQGGQDTPLDGLLTTTAKTRAAAGYSRQTPGASSFTRAKIRMPSDSEEDLDAPSTYRSTQAASQAISQASSFVEFKKPRLGSFYDATDTSQVDGKSTVVEDQVTEDDDDEDDDFLARLKKRREDREQTRGGQRNATSTKNDNAKLDSSRDYLPDFL